MAFSRYIYALIVVATARHVNAQIQATTPGPHEIYTAGSPCKLAWNVDTSGTWKNMTIDLMSGSNNNMSLVTNVATGVDGTDQSVTPYSWTCPEVNPYSTIYFYQFSDGTNASSDVWTTRFTITSPSNQTVTPEHATQPNGQAIPWGVGQVKVANSTGSHTHTSSASVPSSGSTAPAPTSTRSKQSHNRLPHDEGSDVSNGGYISDDGENRDDRGSRDHDEQQHGSEHKKHGDTDEANDQTQSASPTSPSQTYSASASATGIDTGGDTTGSDAGSARASGSVAGKAETIAGSEALSRCVRAAMPSYSAFYSLFILFGALAAL